MAEDRLLVLRSNGTLRKSAVGVIFFEAATASRPFQNSSSSDTLVFLPLSLSETPVCKKITRLDCNSLRQIKLSGKNPRRDGAWRTRIINGHFMSGGGQASLALQRQVAKSRRLT